jgi:membrane protein implicated in regulation of membrane protease activity
MFIAWLVFGAILLLFELHRLAFYALFGSIGSLAVALIVPSAVGAPAAVAVAVALAGIVAFRPFVSQAFASHHGGHVARGVQGGVAGQEAITLEEVTDSEFLGHMWLAGERWLAVSGNGDRIVASTPVFVVAVQGTTPVLWPVDPHGSGPEIGSADRDEASDGADGRTS